MRIKSLLHVAAATLCGLAAHSAHAAFHLMQIEQVIGGVNGDTTAQAIQLRMRSPNQNILSSARMRVFDAAGLTPVIVKNFTTNLPPFPPAGTRVLIVSSNFVDLLDPAVSADYVMDNLIPASYLAAGSLTFENNTGSIIYWRLSWGGGNYTGSNSGSCTNDDSMCPAPGTFGPPWPASPGTDPLPSAGLQALQFQGPHTALSTTNANDYDLTAGAAAFTNSSGDSGTVTNPCPEDVNGDSSIDVLDLIELLLCFGQPASPDCQAEDVNGDGTVDVLDLIDLLLLFGTACP